MVCPRCAKVNEDDARFCAKCGRNLEDAQREAKTSAAEEEEVRYCYRHPKEATNLSCGRCGKYICTKCATIGPAGPRCPDCSKTEVAFRPGAIGLGMKRTFRSVGSRGPWAWYYIVILGMLLFGGLQTCGGMLFNQQKETQYDQEQYTPPDEGSNQREGE